jgi:N-acetylglucosaminyl-diphospho-decaprenol L-rhamnosyltransferase
VIPIPPGREEQLGDEAEARRRLRERPEPAQLPPARETIGAVVVTFNDAGHVAATVRDLSEQVARVVVVDVGSKDGTRALVAERFPGLELRELPLEAGFGAAVNAGVALLDQPVLLFLHGDARLRPDALEQLYGTLSDSRRRIGCCGPRLVAPHGAVERSAGFRPTPWRRARAWWTDLIPRSRLLRPRRKPKHVASLAPSVRTDVDWVSGAAMLVRHEAFVAVGGMDESYFLTCGDVDLCLRLRKAGWDVVHEPRARAIHLDRVAENARSRRAARRRLARRHGRLRKLRGGG